MGEGHQEEPLHIGMFLISPLLHSSQSLESNHANKRQVSPMSPSLNRSWEKQTASSSLIR